MWRPRIRDVALWATLTALVTLEGALQSAAWWDLALGVLGLGAAVAVSRAYPLPPLFIAAAYNLAYALDVINRGVPGRAEPFPLAYLAVLLVFSYLAGRRMAYARPVVVGFAVLVAVPLPVILAATISADNVADAGLSMARWFTMIINLLLCGVFPWLVGRYRRQHDELVSAGWQRAEQLERQQRIATEQARLRERSRIAHDMHDSLGHELSLIAVRAAGLEVATDLGERHRRAASELREAAAQATDSLRQVIRVLRDDAESPPTEPAHESVSHLVERVRDSGVAVRLHVSGTPTPLPLMADRAAYSVVREALTNAAKHAPGSGVDVRLEHAAHETVITVTNTAATRETPAISAGDPGGARNPGSARSPVRAHNAGSDRDSNGVRGAGDNGGGTGLGLVGLAERVRLAGGTLRTRPLGDGADGEAALDIGRDSGGGRGPGDSGGTSGAGTGAASRAASRAASGAGVVDLGFEVVARIPHQSPVPAEPPGPGHDGRDDRSESARHLDAVRRRARRGLITAIAVPVTLTAIVSMTMFGVYIYATANAVLPPGDFADLRVGQSRADVQRHLPRWDDIDPAPQRFPPAPSGASCEYFRAHGNLFVPAHNYRLCFARDRLVTKDAVAPDTDADTDLETDPESGPPTTSGSPPR